MQKFHADWNNAAMDWRLALILVAAASAVSLLFGIFGFPVVGQDANVHLNWLDQFVRLREQGINYPRWLPMSFGGFGAATFYFYPPLPYWLASFFHSIYPLSPSGLYNTLVTLASITSIFTTWWLLRQYSSDRITIVACSLAYSFIAYRFADAFVRDALGEQWALACLPLIFLRFENRLQRIVLITIGWSGLFLTNIPTAFIAAISAAIIILIDPSRRRKKEVFDYAISLALAVAISASYLLPAFALRNLIQSQHLWDTHFASTGFAILDLLQDQPGWLKTLASATLLAGIVCVIATWRDRKLTPRGWFWTAIVAILIQIPIERPWWHSAIPFGVIQFSWRWNSVLLLAIVVISVSSKSTAIPLVLIGLAAITLVGEARISNEFFLHPKLPFDRYRNDAPEYAPRWAPADAAEVRAIAWAHIDDPPATLLGFTFPGDSIHLLSQKPDERLFNVQLSRATPTRFHLFYWPYWKAFRGNKTIGIQPDTYGFATAQLPAGSYEIRMTLVHSPYEITGAIISYFGLAALVGLLTWNILQTRFKKVDSSSTESA
ncbi:MAG TPA: glycosyltransferase family 39 protein [Candidatus Kapabacteria bacterium]|jgi:hypothetical protein|nr:glycosyltransferase family 39 protein [Candidatus Kapabacteria bacterium]